MAVEGAAGLTPGDQSVSLPGLQLSLPTASSLFGCPSWSPWSDSKGWWKVVLVTSTATGALIFGAHMVRSYFVSEKKVKAVPVNGGVKEVKESCSVDGTGSSSSNLLTAPAPRQCSVSQMDEVCGGLAILLEEGQPPATGSSQHSSMFRRLSGGSGHRKRSDSGASGTTTLLLTTRSPSELLLYGLESLKRAVRLWEETRSRLTVSVKRESSVDSELEFILCKAKQLIDDVEDYRKEITPERDVMEEEDEEDYDRDDDVCSQFSERSFGTSTTFTMPYFDIEPNIHFFKLYTQALDNVESCLSPRVDRTHQVNCGSEAEFRAKVHCLRMAFESILTDEENCQFFADMGRDILDILLTHSLRDPTECLSAYDEFLEFVSCLENQDSLLAEVALRRIPCLSFYDLVLDYIILDSLDDLENPPSAVLSVANNKWLSSGFRELALQTAVSAVLRHKRGRLLTPSGFFGHFYNILDHISPILAWGFLGSDYDLKFKCNLIKESLQELIRDYFSFDRVRYTSLTDLCDDILRITDSGYNDLQSKLSVCK